MEFLRSAGNDNACVPAVELLKKLTICGSTVLGDRACGARSIREYIPKHGANCVIPPQSNVPEPWPVDWHLNKERRLMECFFQKIKWFRRIAPDTISWTPLFLPAFTSLLSPSCSFKHHARFFIQARGKRHFPRLFNKKCSVFDRGRRRHDARTSRPACSPLSYRAGALWDHRDPSGAFSRNVGSFARIKLCRVEPVRVRLRLPPRSIGYIRAA